MNRYLCFLLLLCFVIVLYKFCRIIKNKKKFKLCTTKQIIVNPTIKDSFFYFYVRGHIRDSFRNNRLRNFIDLLKLTFPNVQIIFQTWSTFQCKKNHSWRKVNENNQVVYIQHIQNYFKNIPPQNLNCMILDDDNIPYYGSIEGNIADSKMPKKGWKNMWYGIAKGLEKSLTGCYNNPIVNFRFDFFDVPLSNDVDAVCDYHIIEFIHQYLESKSNTISFFYKNNDIGVDNLYIGPLNKIKCLNNYFNYHLDEIDQMWKSEKSQEHLVPKIAECINDGSLSCSRAALISRYNKNIQMLNKEIENRSSTRLSPHEKYL